ncbi:MAG: endonuclease/exonuclease/phosphatase family protein [Anaerolineales bacterium]
MRERFETSTRFPFFAVSWGYLSLLFTWLALYMATGDHFGYLGLVNMIAVYLFLPLPFVFLSALLYRSIGLLVGFGAALLVFLWLWGGLFSPLHLEGIQTPKTNQGELTILTYNVLAWHDKTAQVLANIRAENPDVVFLQELNTELARTLQSNFSETYPYQALEPVDNPTGMGVISKYPIHPTGDTLPDHWIGGPMILALDWNGRTVTLVNFHMYPTFEAAPPSVISHQFRLRETQAKKLAGLARQSGPVIMAGDANAAPLNESYKIITSELHDAWSESGFGLGHTFPGNPDQESNWPKIGPLYLPPWLTRIDYIFHSGDWETVTVRVAQFDGVSDHRGVVATLVFR